MLTVASEDVCWSIRNVKFVIIKVSYTMRLLFLMFVTAVCAFFLLKLSFVCFIPFDWHWIDTLREFSKLLMYNYICLIFKTKTGEFQWWGSVIFTLTAGYFKKCVSFLLQWSRFCETIIIFEERKGYISRNDNKAIYTRKKKTRLT